MKKINIYFFTLLLILPFIGKENYCQNINLKVATFNCEFLTRPKVHLKFGYSFNLTGADKDLWDQPGYRDQKFSEASEAVAQLLSSVNADVLALTEVGDSTDVAELRGDLLDLGIDYQYWQVCKSTDYTTKQHVAVLSKFPFNNTFNQIPGRETYLKEEDDPESEYDTGISKGMRVTITAYGNDILLYILHLSSERGGHEQDQQRISQASIVRRHYLDELRNGANVIVAGDLNDYRGQPAIHRIRGLDDIFDDLIQTGNVKYFEETELDTRWTYEYQGVRHQIDHILLSYSIKNICKKSGGIKTSVFEHNNHLASDHRPFIVTLNFKN